MRTVFNLIRIVRPHNIAAAVLSTLVGFAMTGSRSWPWMLVSAVALSTAAGNVINDLYDIDIDRINKPARPLPSGAVSVRAARVLYISLLAALAFVMLRLPWPLAFWIAAWAVLLHLYSSHFKRVYLAGNLLVSVVSASGFLVGAYAGDSIHEGLVPALFTFVFVLGRELVKDCEDERGDRLTGARTVPVVSGTRTALNTAVGIFIALAIGFPIPGVLGFYRNSYTLIMLVTVVPLLVVSAVLASRERSLALVSLLLKTGMFFGVSAFYFGAS
jgi:geranylgeranylglycerol-phosphate geranylgeranyltransferase